MAMNLNDILAEKHITEPKVTKPRYQEDGGIFWYKGETVKLAWDIDGDIKNTEDNTYVLASKFMENKTVVVKMFNYMGQVVKEWKLENPGTRVEILVDGDFAKELKTGTYQIAISVYNLVGLVHELVSREDCIVEVR